MTHLKNKVVALLVVIAFFMTSVLPHQVAFADSGLDALNITVMEDDDSLVIGFSGANASTYAEAVDKIVVNAGLTSLGRIYWADDNIVRQNFYATLNAKVSLTKGIFTWDLWGKNLTGTDYIAYSFKMSTGNYAQKGKTLTFGTSLSMTF